MSETENKKTVDNEPADFEKAIDAAGYGLFHYMLIFLCIPGSFGVSFSTSIMSYILPVSECDLQLTLIDKGTLNSVTYAGMMLSSIAWGYFSDTKGRKKALVIGYLADMVCVFLCSLSQNFSMLSIMKFFEGFIANGPSTVILTYVSEFHNSKNRQRVFMIMGFIMSSSNLVLPILALFILSNNWNFIIFHYFNFHSWQLFLAISGFPSLICGLALIYLPESPKFLMTHGHNDEALKVFQRIYAINNRKAANTYPICQLKVELTVSNTLKKINNNNAKKEKNENLICCVHMRSLKNGWIQMRPMFQKPLLLWTVEVYALQFFIILGFNTVRLWLPQLFASFSEYETAHPNSTMLPNLCTILEYNVNITNIIQTDYVINCDTERNLNSDAFINNIIIAAVSMVGYSLAVVFIKTLRTRNILIYGLFLSACLSVVLYFSTNNLQTLIIASLFMTISSLALSSLMGTIIAIFPTSQRSLVFAISLMFGRLGSVIGSMLFSILIELGCLPPFLMVSIALFFAAFLAILIPNPNNNEFV